MSDDISDISEQTKIIRAIDHGLLPYAHPDELKVLHFLADKANYAWTTGGAFMTQGQWAKMIVISDSSQLRKAIKRLHDHNLVESDGSHGPRGLDPVEYKLTWTFVKAAVDYYDQIIVKDNLARLVTRGVDPVKHYRDRKGMDKVTLPPRPKRPPKKTGRQKARQRWFDEDVWDG